MSPEDNAFIRKERRLVSSWPLLSGGALFVLLASYLWLSASWPQLVNPAYVYNSLKNDTLAHDTLITLAMLAPLLAMMLFALIGVVLGYSFVFVRRAKRLLDIIDRLRQN